MSTLQQRPPSPAGRENQMRVSMKNDGYYYLEQFDTVYTGDYQQDKNGKWERITVPAGTHRIYDRRIEGPIRRGLT